MSDLSAIVTTLSDSAPGFWILAFLLALAVLQVVYCTVIRLCRLAAIALRGWPPAHCDADGDSVEVFKARAENP